MTNISDSPHDQGTLALTALSLVPSCGVLEPDPSCAFGAGADLGVVTIGDAATGVAGACTGTGFTVGLPNATTGKRAFTTDGSIGLTPLGSAGSTCRVRFDYTVHHMPVKDANNNPNDGLRTNVLAAATGAASWDGATVTRPGWNPVTVVRDTPELTARAEPRNIQLGASTCVGARSSAARIPTARWTSTSTDPTTPPAAAQSPTRPRSA